MTWELLGVNGKGDSRATESYHFGTLIFQLELGEPGAKEPPQALKLYFINQDDLGFGGMWAGGARRQGLHRTVVAV